jgi:hypothetical protein
MSPTVPNPTEPYLYAILCPQKCDNVHMCLAGGHRRNVLEGWEIVGPISSDGPRWRRSHGQGRKEESERERERRLDFCSSDAARGTRDEMESTSGSPWQEGLWTPFSHCDAQGVVVVAVARPGLAHAG